MELLADLVFDDLLPDAPFAELHTRSVALPIEQVWPACLDVTIAEIRTFGPLLAIRELPKRLFDRERVDPPSAKPLLDAFVGEGFIVLRKDTAPVNGRATVIFGAAGKFWSPLHNLPQTFASPADFVAFDETGWAKTVARVDAIAEPDGTTRIETETLVAGTDAASSRKFGFYWAVIRLPSGLIRRSWLKAIERRAIRAVSS